MSRDYAKINESKRQRLLDLVLDLEWHTHVEMLRVGGINYRSRLVELQRLGYKFESAEIEGAIQGKQHRLLSREPSEPKEKKVRIMLSEADTVSLVLGVITERAEKVIKESLSIFQFNRKKL